MGASLNGVPFDLDPTSVRWSYQVHKSSTEYIGGKVVQVFGSSISDITVEGQFGQGGWRSQEVFLRRIKALGKKLVSDPTSTPNRFLWPEFGWDFQVWIKGYSSVVDSMSVKLDDSIVVPQWRLIFHPVTGTSALEEASITKYIERLSDGLGWQLTSYNGSLSISDAQEALLASGTSSREEFSKIAFGFGQLPQNDAQQTQTSGQNFPAGATLNVDQMLILASNAGFKGNDISIAVAIARGESGWNSSSHNGNTSTGDDSWGLWQINLIPHGDRFGSSTDLMVPERNAAAAFALYVGRGHGFQDWSVYKSGKYLEYLADVQNAANRLGIG